MTTNIIKSKNVRLRPKEEQGMAMVIALLMGIVLFAGGTGLMMRQLMARKLGASESYQQMAESAALNGLNRILSDLNRNDRNNYTGFLLSLNNDDDKRGWGVANTEGYELVELCTPVTRYIAAYPSGEQGPAPEIFIDNGNMRNDGIKNAAGEEKAIEVGYRLRSYNTTATAGNGEGTFYVEGIVSRGDKVLARALLRRSLYISSKVAGSGDWAVMTGNNLRLNNTNIVGPGNIFYLTNSPETYAADQYATSCSDNSLLADVGSNNTKLAGKTLTNQVWPININETKRGVGGMPPPNLFERDPINDTTTASNGDTIRMWSFDDSDPAPADRDNDGELDLESDGATETLYPALPCGEIVCVRDADQTNSSDFRTLEEEGISIDISGSTITLDTNVLCKGSNNFDCHVYLDHINLSKTKLHITTSDARSVVLHIEQPVAYPNNGTISRAIHLSGTAELCGVNKNGTSCNGNPEQLVITATSGDAPTDVCNTPERTVRFTGDTLPYALIYLPTGTIRPNNATLSGLSWASSICVLNDAGLASSFTLNTQRNNTPIVERAYDNWDWLSRFNYQGYGRKVTRAIRGTSLDTFERW
jgi:hypothetical protein